MNAEFAKIILEDFGLHVDLARDGLECVDKVIQKPVGTYDFILMDIQMPNMNGYLATQKKLGRFQKRIRFQLLR